MPDVSDEPTKEVVEDPERAREEDGTYKGDDKDTPDVNEAYVDGKGKPKKGKSKPKDESEKQEDALLAPPRRFHPGPVTAPINPGVQKRLDMKARARDPRSPEPMSSKNPAKGK